LRVLLIAYACEPNKGSEPSVGWNWAISLSKFIDVTVVTRSNNKDNIEKVLTENINIKFVYFDIPLFSKIKKKIIIGTHLYYFIWQLFLPFFIIFKTSIKHFDIIHHVTFNSFSIPCFLWLFPKRFVWGPIGGGQITNFKFLPFFGKKVFFEIFRSIYIFMAKFNPFIIFQNIFSYKIIVANDETLLRLLFKKKAIKMLETGIESVLSFSEIEEKKISDRFFKILWVGNLEPHKCPSMLIDALSQLNNLNLKVKIIGTGSLNAKLNRKIRKLGLNNKIELLGYIDYKNIKEYYINSDIFVFTSIRDTSGNVVLEAMSCGLPVIVFDHQGVRDIVTKECGIKIPVTNYEEMVIALANSIDYLYKNPNLRLQMGKAAIERIKKDFLWENKARSMVKLYKEILNENTTNT